MRNATSFWQLGVVNRGVVRARGSGRNATHFSDDLTDLDHDAYGWFVRLLGKY